MDSSDYTNEQIQAAMDKAFSRSITFSFTTDQKSLARVRESTDRLQLGIFFLAFLKDHDE